MQENTKAILALLITIILWASAFVGIRFAVTSYSAGGLALLRYIVAAIVIFIPFMRLKNKQKPNIKDLLYFLLLGLMGFTLYNIFLNYGEKTTSASVANFIIAQIPILVSLIAIFAFKEYISRKGIIGFILSFLGIVLILLGENEHHLDIGIILVVLAAICGSIYSVLQKPLLKRYHPIEITSYAIWTGTLCLLIYTPELITDLKYSHFNATASVIYMGIFPGAIAYSLYCYGYKYMPVAKASSFLYLMPFFTLILAWLFLGELPSLLAIIGGLIALLGSIVVTRSR
ncbi:DMT family transporter [Thiotrichales bacterium 19S3-7]|nr:DMT family transporter [Thiotrichales bacterium 19S3-7]MCF6801737.1 DMT family transporter [Thiotrichales bacterium 19S3-11]